MNPQLYPMVRLTVPFIAGMVTANFCIRFIPLNMSVLFTILCALLIFLFTTYPTRLPIKQGKGFGITAMLFAFFSGMTLFMHSYDHVSWKIAEKKGTIFHGIVAESPTRKPKTWSVKIHCENGKQILAYIARDSTETSCLLHPGDSIRFEARHLQSTSPQYAESASATPSDSIGNQFSQYHKYLFYNGISATCYVPRNGYTVTHTEPADRNLLARIRLLQNKAIAAYANAGIEGDAAAIIESMTSGHKARLSKEMKEKYSRSGVSHVLALSGFHLTIIYTLLEFLLLGRVLRHRYRSIVRIVIMICLWIFTVMAGMPPSLVRAALMCSFMILSSILSRQSLSMNSCALAALVMLIYNPLTLFDLGFQLSFISMTGICVCGKPLCALCPTHNIIVRYLWGIVAISLTCTLFTAPIIGLCFHYLPTFSVFSNLAVSVLASLILYVAAFWWMLCWQENIKAMLTDILQWLTQTMNTIVSQISSWKYAVIEWQPSIAEVITLYILIAFLVLFFKNKSSKNLIGILSTVVILCAIMILRKTGCLPSII